MWYVIITARSLLWMLVSLVATLFMLAALVSPSWLTAATQNVTYHNETVKYTPSVGVYTRCSKPSKHSQMYRPSCTTLAARGFGTDSEVFPTAWKAATVFIAFGLTVMCVTVFSSIISCCFQSVFKKSIFTMSGAAQAFAGIFYIVGVMLHPMAWGSTRVQKLCGREASPFYLDECMIGVGLWFAVIGTLLTFFSACLSVPAEKSTSSDKVQDKIYEGHTLICLL